MISRVELMVGDVDEAWIHSCQTEYRSSFLSGIRVGMNCLRPASGWLVEQETNLFAECGLHWHSVTM